MTSGEFLRAVPETLPTHLEKAPIVEAIFELRLTPSHESISELLPGILFSKVGHRYKRNEATPIAGMPKEFLLSDPKLRYQISYKLHDDEGGSLNVGNLVTGISVGPKYEGWAKFYTRIDEYLTVVKESGLVKDIERFSMKSINLLEHTMGEQLGLLNLMVEIGGIKANENGFRLRTECNDEVYKRIIEIQTGVILTLKPSGENKYGLLLSLDCVRPVNNSEQFWATYREEVGNLHDQIKKLFFGLITKDTLTSFLPKY